MLIILEGPDGSGKTTLAQRLERAILRSEPRSTVEVRHCGPPQRHPLDEYLRSVSGHRPRAKQHLILDRFHWGEWVYPHVRGRVTKLDGPMWNAIEQFLLRLGAVVITCSQYGDRYRDVFEARDELQQLHELPEVEKWYRYTKLVTQLPLLHYNWESAIDGDPHRILKAANVADQEHQLLNRYVTYSGPARPNYLLLGDVRHGLDVALEQIRDRRFRNLDPAFVPFLGTSGHFLRGALNGHLLPQHYGIANACDVDDPLRLWEDLGRPTTVALGRRAQAACRRLGITDAAVPHPQYVRRFHHARRYEYGRLIADALRDRGDYGAWPSRSTARPVRTLTSRSSKTFAGVDDAVRAATA